MVDKAPPRYFRAWRISSVYSCRAFCDVFACDFAARLLLLLLFERAVLGGRDERLVFV